MSEDITTIYTSTHWKGANLMRSLYLLAYRDSEKSFMSLTYKLGTYACFGPLRTSFWCVKWWGLEGSWTNQLCLPDLRLCLHNSCPDPSSSLKGPQIPYCFREEHANAQKGAHRSPPSHARTSWLHRSVRTPHPFRSDKRSSQTLFG
jgi:hypothetical protein